MIHYKAAFYSKITTVLITLTLASHGVSQELAPDFVGKEIHSGQPIALADYRGKVVFIDFWASWCPPCLVSLPAYNKMYQDIDKEEFEIIAINVDEDPEDGLYFLEDHPVSYPVLADPEGDIGKPYGIRTLPVSYLLDRDGRIVQSSRNFKLGDEVDLQKTIEALLQKK